MPPLCLFSLISVYVTTTLPLNLFDSLDIETPAFVLARNTSIDHILDSDMPDYNEFYEYVATRTPGIIDALASPSDVFADQNNYKIISMQHLDRLVVTK